VDLEWDHFATNMSFNGVSLSNEKDKLVSNWDKSASKVTKKIVYMEISTSSCQVEGSWWHALI